MTPQPRIAIDAHTLGTQAGGNETYVRELLRALQLHAPDADLIAFVNRAYAAHPDLAFGGFCRLLANNAYARMGAEIPWRCRQLGADVLHVQYTRPLVATCPYVVSVHDLVARHMPETLPASVRYRLRYFMGATVRRAAQVFVLTEAIQREIMEVYDLPPERFALVSPALDSVLYRPVDAESIAAVRARYRLPEHYVLYVGQIYPRKNLVRLARAIARLRRAGYPHRLVIVGRRAWLYDEMLAAIEALGLEDWIVMTGYVAREDLPAIFCGAGLFGYLSLYEGFGIPVAEALACGVPVLASQDPALREVAGGLATHVDGHDDDAILAAMQTMLDDPALRARSEAAAPEIAARYSSERMAAAAMAGYRRAAS